MSVRGLARPRVVAVVLALAPCAAAGCAPAPALLFEGAAVLRVEPLEVRLVRITDRGLEPATPVELTVDEGGVAFVNDTRSALVAIVFPRHALSELRCSYTEGFESADGVTFTATPLPPGGAASVCLHDPGRLVYEVHGVGAAGGAPLAGRIDVRDERDRSPHEHDHEHEREHEPGTADVHAPRAAALGAREAATRQEAHR